MSITQNYWKKKKKHFTCDEELWCQLNQKGNKNEQKQKPPLIFTEIEKPQNLKIEKKKKKRKKKGTNKPGQVEVRKRKEGCGEWENEPALGKAPNGRDAPAPSPTAPCTPPSAPPLPPPVSSPPFLSLSLLTAIDALSHSLSLSLEKYIYPVGCSLWE